MPSNPLEHMRPFFPELPFGAASKQPMDFLMDFATGGLCVPSRHNLPQRSFQTSLLMPSLPMRFFTDFHQNYRRFEHWQMRRRQDSVQAKVQSSARGLFLATRKPPKASLDCVEEVIAQKITLVDSHQSLVSVPVPFPKSGIHKWTLQNDHVLVQPHGPLYKLDSDLLLVDGQTFACHLTIHEASDIHQRLIDLWSPRWSKRTDVPEHSWNRIVDFAQAHLPRKHFSLPKLTVEVWKKAVRSFKQTAATGPSCGSSRQDLLQMTDAQVQGIIAFFEQIESSAKWPAQFTVGLIHLLQKKDDCHDVNGFRPITVMSMLYRVYTGIRAGQLLSQIASLAADWQCGFMQGKQAADLWIFIGVCVELSLQQQTPVHGYVADLVKAYNTLPRSPVFRLLACIGVPGWFLSCWNAHLLDFSRMFVVRGACSVPVSSCTGFPEGCPLSCVAMSVIDLCWHVWQSRAVPRSICLSFVDNLEVVCDRAEDVVLSLSSFREFCDALDVQIDEPKLYGWSTGAAGRETLRANGLRISLSERDLGGQATYCATETV